MNKRSQSAVVGAFKQHSFTLAKGHQNGGRGGGRGGRGGRGRHGEEENPEDALPDNKEDLQVKVDDFYRLPPQTIPLIDKRNYGNFMYGGEQQQQQQQYQGHNQQGHHHHRQGRVDNRHSNNNNNQSNRHNNQNNQNQSQNGGWRNVNDDGKNNNNHNNNQPPQSMYQQQHQASYEGAPPSIENTFYQNGAVLELCKIVQVGESFNLLKSAPASMVVDTAGGIGGDEDEGGSSTASKKSGSSSSPPKKKYGGDNDSVTVMIRPIYPPPTSTSADGVESTSGEAPTTTTEMGANVAAQAAAGFEVEVQVFDPCRPYQLLSACRGWLVSNLLIESPTMAALNNHNEQPDTTTTTTSSSTPESDKSNLDQIQDMRIEIKALLEEVESLHTVGWSSTLLKKPVTGLEAAATSASGSDINASAALPLVSTNPLCLHHGMSIRVLSTLLGALKPLSPAISTRLSSSLVSVPAPPPAADDAKGNNNNNKRFNKFQPQAPVVQEESDAVIAAVLKQLQASLTSHAGDSHNATSTTPPAPEKPKSQQSKEEKEQNRNLFIVDKVAELQRDLFSLKISAMYACLARAQYMIVLEGRMKALCERVETLAKNLGLHDESKAKKDDKNVTAAADGEEGADDVDVDVDGEEVISSPVTPASAEIQDAFRSSLRGPLVELQAFYRQLRLFFIREVPHFNRVLTAADVLDRETAKRMTDLLTCFTSINSLSTLSLPGASSSTSTSLLDGDGDDEAAHHGDEAGEAMLKVNKGDFLARLAGGPLSSKLIQYHSGKQQHSKNNNNNGAASSLAPHYPFYSLERAALVTGLFSTCGRYARYITTTTSTSEDGSVVSVAGRIPFTLVPLQVPTATPTLGTIATPTAPTTSTSTSLHHQSGCTASGVDVAAFAVLATRLYNGTFVNFLRYQLPRAILHTVMLFHKDGGARWLADYSSSHYSSLFENYASICAGDRRVDLLLESSYLLEDNSALLNRGATQTTTSQTDANNNNDSNNNSYDSYGGGGGPRGLAANEWGQLLVQLFGPSKPHYPPFVAISHHEEFLVSHVAQHEQKSLLEESQQQQQQAAANAAAVDEEDGEPTAAENNKTSSSSPASSDEDSDDIASVADASLDKSFREFGRHNFVRALQQYYLSVYGVRTALSATPVQQHHVVVAATSEEESADVAPMSEEVTGLEMVKAVLDSHQVVILTGVGDVDALRGTDAPRRLQQVFSSLSAAQAGSFIRGGRQGMRNQQYGSNNNNISVAPTTSSTTEASPTTTPQELNAAVSSLLKTRVTWVASGVSVTGAQGNQFAGALVGSLAGQQAQRQLQRQSKGLAALHDFSVKALLAEWFVYVTDAAPLLADRNIVDSEEAAKLDEDEEGLTQDEMLREEINEKILATHPILSPAAAARLLGPSASAALPHLATLAPVSQLYGAVFPSIIGPALLALLHTDKGPVGESTTNNNTRGGYEPPSHVTPQAIGTLLETLVFLFLHNNVGARAPTPTTPGNAASSGSALSSNSTTALGSFSSVDRLYAVILEAVLKTLVASAASGYRSLRDIRKLIGGITTILFASSSSIALNAATAAQSVEADLSQGGGYQQNAARDLVHLVDPAELQQLLTVLRPKLFQLFEFYNVGHLVHIPSLDVSSNTAKKATAATTTSPPPTTPAAATVAADVATSVSLEEDGVAAPIPSTEDAEEVVVTPEEEVEPEVESVHRLHPGQLRMLWRQGSNVTTAAQEITVLCGSLTKLHQHLQRAMPFVQVALDTKKTPSSISTSSSSQKPSSTSGATTSTTTGTHATGSTSAEEDSNRRFKRLVTSEAEAEATSSSAPVRRRKSKTIEAAQPDAEEAVDSTPSSSTTNAVAAAAVAAPEALAAAVSISALEQDTEGALKSLLTTYPGLLSLPPLQQPNKPLTLDVVRLFVERYVYLHTAALAVPSVDVMTAFTERVSVLSSTTTDDTAKCALTTPTATSIKNESTTRSNRFIEAMIRMQQFTNLAPSQQVVGAGLMGFVSVVSRLMESVVTQELRLMEQLHTHAGAEVANVLASVVGALSSTTTTSKTTTPSLSEAAIKTAHKVAYRRLLGTFFSEGANRDEALRDIFPTFHSDVGPVLALVGVSMSVGAAPSPSTTASSTTGGIAAVEEVGGIPFPPSHSQVDEMDALLSGSPTPTITATGGTSSSSSSTSADHVVNITATPQRVSGSIIARFFTLQLRRVCVGAQLARMERELSTTKSDPTPAATTTPTSLTDIIHPSSSSAILRLFTNQPGTDTITSTMTLFTSLLQVVQGSQQLIRAVSGTDGQGDASMIALVDGLLSQDVLLRHVLPVLGEVVPVSSTSLAHSTLQQPPTTTTTTASPDDTTTTNELFLFPNIYTNMNARKQIRDVRNTIESILASLPPSLPATSPISVTLCMLVRGLSRSPTATIQVLTKEGLLVKEGSGGGSDVSTNPASSSSDGMMVAGPNGGRISFAEVSGNSPTGQHQHHNNQHGSNNNNNAPNNMMMKTSADSTGYAASSFSGGEAFEAIDKEAILRLSSCDPTITTTTTNSNAVLHGADVADKVHLEEEATTTTTTTAEADAADATTTSTTVIKRGIFIDPQYQELSAAEVGEIARRLQGRIRVMSSKLRGDGRHTDDSLSPSPVAITPSPSPLAADVEGAITVAATPDAASAVADVVDGAVGVSSSRVDDVDDAIGSLLTSATGNEGVSAASRLRSAAHSVATLIMFASFYTSGVQSPFSSLLIVLEDAERELLGALPSTADQHQHLQPPTATSLLRPSLVVSELFADSGSSSSSSSSAGSTSAFIPKATFKMRDSVGMLHALYVCGEEGSLSNPCFPGHTPTSATSIDHTNLDQQRFRLCTQLLRLKAEQQFLETCVLPLIAVQALPFAVKLTFSASRILERQKTTLDEIYDLVTSAPGADKALRLSPNDCHLLYSSLAKIFTQLFTTLSSRCDEKLRVEKHQLLAIQGNAHAQQLQLGELQELLGDREGISGMSAATRHEVTSTASILRASIGALSTDAEGASQRLLTPLATVLQICAKVKQQLNAIKTQHAVIEGKAALHVAGASDSGNDLEGGDDASDAAAASMAAAASTAASANDAAADEMDIAIHGVAENVCETITCIVNIQHSVRALSTDSNDVVARSSSLLGSAAAFLRRGGGGSSSVLLGGAAATNPTVLPAIQRYILPFTSVVGTVSNNNNSGAKGPTDVPIGVSGGGGVPSMFVSDDVIDRLSAYDKLGRALFPSILNHLKDLNHRHMGLLYAVLPDIQRFATPQKSSATHIDESDDAASKRAKSVAAMPLFTPAQFFLLLRAYSSLGVWNNRAMGPVCDGLLQVFLLTSSANFVKTTITATASGSGEGNDDAAAAVAVPLPPLSEAISGFKSSVNLLFNLKRSNFIPSSCTVNLSKPPSSPSSDDTTTTPSPLNADGDDESRGYDGKFIYREEEGSVVERLVEHTIHHIYNSLHTQVQPHVDLHSSRSTTTSSSSSSSLSLLPNSEDATTLTRAAVTAVGCLGHLALPPEPLFSMLVGLSVRSLLRDVQVERNVSSSSVVPTTIPDVSANAMPPLIRAILTGKNTAAASTSGRRVSATELRFESLVACLSYYDRFLSVDSLASSFPMHSQTLLKAAVEVLLFINNNNTSSTTTTTASISATRDMMSDSAKLVLRVLIKAAHAGERKHLQRCPHIFFADYLKEIFNAYTIATRLTTTPTTTTTILSPTDTQGLLTAITESMATTMIYNKRIFSLATPASSNDITLDDISILPTGASSLSSSDASSSDGGNSSVTLAAALLTIPNVVLGSEDATSATNKWPLPAKALLADALSVAVAAIHLQAAATPSSSTSTSSLSDLETGMVLRRTTSLLCEALLYDVYVDCSRSLAGTSGAAVVSGPIASAYMSFSAVVATSGLVVSQHPHSILIAGQSVAVAALLSSDSNTTTPAAAAASLVDPSIITDRILVAAARCAALRQKTIALESCYRLQLATNLLVLPTTTTTTCSTSNSDDVSSAIPPAVSNNDTTLSTNHGVSDAVLAAAAAKVTKSDTATAKLLLSETSQLAVEASRLATYSSQKIAVIPPSSSLDARVWASLQAAAIHSKFIHSALLLSPANVNATTTTTASPSSTVVSAAALVAKYTSMSTGGFTHPTLWDAEAISRLVTSQQTRQELSSSALPTTEDQTLMATSLGVPISVWTVLLPLKLKKLGEGESLASAAALVAERWNARQAKKQQQLQEEEEAASDAPTTTAPTTTGDESVTTPQEYEPVVSEDVLTPIEDASSSSSPESFADVIGRMIGKREAELKAIDAAKKKNRKSKPTPKKVDKKTATKKKSESKKQPSSSKTDVPSSTSSKKTTKKKGATKKTKKE